MTNQIGKRTKFETSAGEADGYLAQPAGERAGVLVIQEWWGLVPHIEDVANRFAQVGYVALAPDLYHGKATTEEAEAEHLMKGLDWGRAVAELGGAVKRLRQVDGCRKVFAAGFCMGGALTMLAAATAGIDGYAAFYGFPPQGAPVDRIEVPGLLFFGDKEEYFSIPDARAFTERQRARGIKTELVVYQGAGHAFFNDARPAVYEPTAANDAWRRTLALFGSLR